MRVQAELNTNIRAPKVRNRICFMDLRQRSPASTLPRLSKTLKSCADGRIESRTGGVTATQAAGGAARAVWVQ